MTDAKIRDLAQTATLAEWKDFLDQATLQEATYAQLEAHRAGRPEHASLAFKRGQHLDGEIRHPNLWP